MIKKNNKKKLLQSLLVLCSVIVGSSTLIACAPRLDDPSFSQSLNPTNNNDNNNSLAKSIDFKKSAKDFKFSPSFYRVSKLINLSLVDQIYQDYEGVFAPSKISELATFKNLIVGLNNKTKIVNDILDNLKFLDLTDENLAIDFNQLLINFDLVTNNLNLTNPSSETKITIKNFSMQLNIANNHNNNFSLFNNAVIIPAKSRANVKIKLNSGLIKLYLTKDNDSSGQVDQYFVAWKIVGDQPGIIETIVIDSALVNSKKNLFSSKKVSEIHLLNAHSFAINTYFSNVDHSISYKTIHNQAITKIANLTSEQLKADLNNTEINLTRIYYVNLIKDIYNVLEYCISNNILQINGEKTSLIKLLYNEPSIAAKRAFLDNFDVPEILKDFLVKLVTPPSTTNGVTNENSYGVDDIIRFFTALIKLNLVDYLYQDFDIQIEWIEDPVINKTNLRKPTVSFKYHKTITLKKEIIIPLKGTVEINNKTETYDATKFFNLGTLLSSLNLGFENSANLFGMIFNELSSKINLSKVTIPANTKIVTTYQAKNNYLDFYMPKTFDRQVAKNYTYGWQVNGVKSSTDYSSLYQIILPTLSELNFADSKINNTDLFGAIQAFNLFKKFQNLNKKDNSDQSQTSQKPTKKPKKQSVSILDTLLKILNYFYLPYYQSNDPNFLTPIEKLLKYLLADPIVFINDQITAWTSNAFYYFPEKINDQALYLKTTDWKKPHHTIYQTNPNLDLKFLLSNVLEAISANNLDQNFKQVNNYRLIWKSNQDQITADNYLKLLSKDTSVIETFKTHEAYQNIIKTLKSNSQVVNNNDYQSQLINQFETVATNNFQNNLANATPKVAIIKIPLFSALSKIFSEDFALNHFLAKNDLIKNILKNFINTVVELDPYLVSTVYPLTPDVISKKTINNFSDDLGDIKNTTIDFIAPIIDFTKLVFPSISEILKSLKLF
ncbi:hypothetical protein MCAV_01480 [[Mycoplasma] cavipharyngis]|uniref:hypothetical protein n=1 Tax=[Mycoplasma] cavipharyngis TaxID=92757 RepID=UPI003703EF1B